MENEKTDTNKKHRWPKHQMICQPWTLHKGHSPKFPKSLRLNLNTANGRKKTDNKNPKNPSIEKTYSRSQDEVNLTWFKVTQKIFPGKMSHGMSWRMNQSKNKFSRKELQPHSDSFYRNTSPKKCSINLPKAVIFAKIYSDSQTCKPLQIWGKAFSMVRRGFG